MNDIRVIFAGKRGGFTLVDAHDFEKHKWFGWCQTRKRYVYRWENRDGKRKRAWMHREILDAPDGMDVDHENHCTFDNRRRNLRLATDAESARNRNKHRMNFKGQFPTSRHKGVSWLKENNCWHLTIAGRHAGLFDDEHQAAVHYNKAARELFGEFAQLNDVDESLFDPNARRPADRIGRRSETRAIYPGVGYDKRVCLWYGRVQENGSLKKVPGYAKHPETAAWMRDQYITEHGLSLPLTFSETIEEMEPVEEVWPMTPPVFK